MTDHPLDDGVPADDDLPALEAVEARLRATLSHHAGVITVADAPFDPTAPSTLIDLEPERERDAEIHALTGAAWRRIKAERRARRGRVIWIAVATAAAILVGLLVVTRAATGPEVKVGTSTSVVTPPPSVVTIGGPDAALVPTWTPDGMQLWSITAGGADGKRASIPPTTTQLLLATSGDGAMLVQLAPDHTAGAAGTTVPSIPGGTTPIDGDRITLRGTTGRAFTTSGGRTASSRIIEWHEQGVDVTATLRSLTDDQAVLALDALTWRDPAHLEDGFAPPASPDWRIEGEHLASEPTPNDSLAVLLTYGPSAPTGEDPAPLTVTTYGAGDNYPGYLRTQLQGSRRPDGLVDSTSAPFASTPPAYTLVWPDGHTVIVEMGATLDEAVAERVALSVQPLTVVQLGQLRADLSNRLGQGRVLASADLPSGRLELIGTGEPTAICLILPAGDRSCSGRDQITYWRPTPVVGSTIIAGSWWVFAAGPAQVGLRASSPANAAPAANTGTSTSVAAAGSVPRPSRPTPAETATDGSWTFSLLPVTADTTEVSVDLDTHGLNLNRPLV